MKPHELGQGHPLRVGLFGGTFNPIHQGHLRVAMDVVRSLNLDRLFFIPSALPPHKRAEWLATAQDRLRMVCLALADHAQLKACDAEIQRPGPSYSIDTVRQFKAMAPEGTPFFFLLGMDAFLEIHTWKEFERLFDETALVVMSRPGSGQWSTSVRREMETYVQHHIDRHYALSATSTRLEHPSRQKIYLVSVTPMDIASSRLRGMIQRGESIEPWVAPSVALYIRDKGLYR